MTIGEICAEVKEDRSHVLYALQKSYGGKHKYNAALDALCEEVSNEPDGTIILGNLEPYTSGFTGNHWMTFASATNIGFHTACASFNSFAYWDTPDGSIAAMRSIGENHIAKLSALMFSGHFFQRYAEREKLGDVDLQLVTDFMCHNSNSVFQTDPKPHAPGRYRFDIILQHGIGRGYTEGFDPQNPKQPFVAHVKTYLPTFMLTPNQRELTAEARNMQAMKLRPADAYVSMTLGPNCDQMSDFFSDLFVSRGCSPRVGPSFLVVMDNIISAELQMRGITKDQARATMLQLFHYYQQAVFDFAFSQERTNVSIAESVAVAMMANPDLDVEGMLAVMLELPRDHPTIVRQAERMKNACHNLRTCGMMPHAGYH